MSLIDVAVLVAAAWYTQHVLRWESGPFEVFDVLRERVFGVRCEWIGQSWVHVVVRKGQLASMVQCVFCFSFWVGFALLALFVLFSRRPLWWSEFVVYGLAVAGVVSFIGDRRLLR